MSAASHWRRVLALACLCTFTAFVTVFAVPPLLGTIAAAYHLTYSRVAWLMTAYTIVPAVGSFAIGVFKDAYGARVCITAGLGLLAIAGYLVSVAPSFPAMVLFRVLVGLGATCVFVPALATVVFRLPAEQVNRGTGAFFASLNLGLSAALLITPLLMTRGWQLPLRVYAGATALVGLVFLAITQPADLRRTFAATLAPQGGRTRLFDVLNIPVLLVLACNFLLFFQSFGMITFLPEFLNGRGLSAARAGAISMLLGLVVIPGAILAGWLADQTQPWAVAVSGALACALCPWLLLVAHAGFAMALLVSCTALGTSLLTIPVTSVLHHLVPAEHSGKATGLILTSGYTGAFVATGLCGWLLSHFGGYRWVFGTVSLSMLAALVMLAALRRTYQTQWIAPSRQTRRERATA